MCGIFACKPLDQTWLENSLKVQNDRGPDQNAIFSHKDIGISINRLAITGDLESGAQPIFSRSRRLVCVFNGAIYNTDEISKEFFINTNSENDAAFALELFELLGVEFVDYLKGMFSIIIIDTANNGLIVARDYMGIKPLYYVKSDTHVVFSSSLNAIPQKFLKVAKPFPPGKLWYNGKFTYEIKPKNIKICNTESSLIHAVESHIPKEVKWGLSLSGGVDSALLSAIAKSSGHDFKCYSLDTGLNSPDLIAAKEVCNYLGLAFKPVKVSVDDIKKSLPKVVQSLAVFKSETIIGGLLTYFVSKAALSDGLKVLILGEGADEVFGGYDKYIKQLGMSKSESTVNEMMLRDQSNLWISHNMRVDHASMANSIEARVPYQDLNVVFNARNMPLEDKVNVEKRLKSKSCLREVALKYLPKDLAEREKVSPSLGTGLNELVTKASFDLAKTITLKREDFEKFNLRTRLEAVCFSIWKETFPKLSTDIKELSDRNLLPESAL